MHFLKKLLNRNSVIHHTIIKKEEFLTYRLSLDVMTTSTVSEKNSDIINIKGPEENDLRKLALHLYRKYKGKKYEKVFICFYLLGMKTDAGAWATGHFDPNLQIKILREVGSL